MSSKGTEWQAHNYLAPLAVWLPAPRATDP
jgi:hypothetical protein